MYHLSVTLHTKKLTNSEKCFAYQFLGKYSITSNPRKPIIDQKTFPEQEIGGISTLFTLGWLYSNHQMTYFRHLTDMEWKMVYRHIACVKKNKRTCDLRVQVFIPFLQSCEGKINILVHIFPDLVNQENRKVPQNLSHPRSHRFDTRSQQHCATNRFTFRISFKLYRRHAQGRIIG